MAQLEDCYFCGTVEDALDSYPVIPPETYPPEDVQRTVVLCPTCREKLGRVLDPVVEYLDAPETDTLEEHEDDSEVTTGSDDESVATPEANAGAEGTTEESESEPGEREGPEEGVDSDGDAPAEPALPDGTGDVVRLLRNREFPVERDDIVTVATNAYGLRRGECDDAIDALIERGWLIEHEGELHRTD